MKMFNISNITTYCFNKKIFGETYLAAWQTDILIALNLMFCLGNFFANSLVIALLVKTNQLSNYSYRFLFLLAISDVCISIFTQPFQIIVISDVLLYIPCSIILLINILSNTFLRVSTYTIGLIGFDRYVRIQYHLKFKTILNSYRASILMAAICALALVNGIMTFLGYFMNTEIIFRLVTLSTDVTVFIISVVLHVKIIFTLKSRIVASNGNRQTPNRVNERVAKLSSRIVKLMIICMIPVATAATVRSFLEKKLQGSSRGHMEFFVKVFLFGSYVNSIGNAVFFFTMNTPSRKYLKKVIQRTTNIKP